jgi:hypothetical protein
VRSGSRFLRTVFFVAFRVGRAWESSDRAKC